MSASQLQLAGPIGGPRRATPNGRGREKAVAVCAWLLVLAVAIGATVAMPKPNYELVFGGLFGLAGIIALASYSRLEVNVAILALYVGLLDGPLKELIYNQAVSALRDVLIGVVAVGALARVRQRGGRMSLPPLSGWVIAFVAVVVVQAFNPNTLGLVKVIGGFRQQLEWVPMFFFGYALMRSKGRLRKMFVIFGAIALANGLVTYYQTRLTPGELASWGPGYSALVHGTEGLTGRTYVSEGSAHVRPIGLGSDEGFPGAVGVIALTGSLALLATAKRRRRWIAVVFCLGAILSVAVALARLSAVGALLGVAAFVVLSFSAGRRVRAPLSALAIVGILALPLGALVIASEGKGVFSRYESIAPSQVAGTSTSYKEVSLKQIPHVIASTPFGFGLATAGAASAFGGKSTVQLEGHGFSAETQYNYIVDELGLPGLVVWIGMSLVVIFLAVTGLSRVKDVDVRILLAGMFAAFIAFTVMSFDGPVTAGAAFGAYFWFSMGTAAYWFVGPGRRADEHGIVAGS